MKQTSLLQSWTSLLSSHSNNANNHVNTLNSSSKTFKSIDSDDAVLANVLDEYTDNPQSNINSHVNESHENEQFINDALKRPPVLYQPTANDSEHLEGFDVDAGETWIYPTDANLRKYQLNIIEQCLYKNTLVCLPTGLGKTFIAAVAMYNFFRWYPTGISVFMAPTRPLVTQQFTSCSDFIGPFQDSIIELTGSIAQPKRKAIWSTYRVLFLTPQVLMNDLQAGVCPASSIRLLIFDEAHKATGNHAYCQILRILTDPPYNHRQFRIIALSATPASDIEGVQTLMANLLISHLELRTDTSADVRPYTQHRQLETIVVPLGPELTRYYNQLIECIRVPLDRLSERGALSQCVGDLRPERLAKYTIVKAREDWCSKMLPSVTPMESSSIQCDFGLVICLLHGLELLIQHGLRPLYRYLEGVYSGSRASPLVRSQLNKLPHMNYLWTELAQRFGMNVECADGVWKQECIGPELLHSQSPFVAGHPKLDKLKEILCNHFRSYDKTNVCEKNSTRVIVFTQFRDSVEEIMHMLKHLRPLIRPASFIGQGTRAGGSPSVNNQGDSPKIATPRLSNGQGGISQRDQIRVMDAFRSGVYNTLVSTCVGEEGIDVGQVDLIVCFDASRSPIRLMQRLGRTGRKRLGRIVVLLTAGREERNHAISIAKTSSVHKALLEGDAYRKLAFYPHNPRMVPLSVQPKLHFKSLQIEKKLVDKESPRSRPVVQKKSLRENVYKLHAESVGLDQLPIRLHAVTSSPILYLLKSVATDIPKSDYPTITDMYNLTSHQRLDTFRETMQSTLVKQSNVGSSSSSQHLMSVLRLVDFHRRGLTQLSYHALGLRNVDIETNMSRIIKTAPLSQSSQVKSPSSPQEKCMPSTDILVTKPTNITIDCNMTNSIAEFVHCLKAIKGLVSNELFIDPRVSDFNDCTEECSQILNHLQDRKDVITVKSLKAGLNKWLASMDDQKCSPLLIPLSPQLDLKLNLENSLLEAINTEIQLPGEIHSFDEHIITNDEYVEEPKTTASPLKTETSLHNAVKDTTQSFNLHKTLNSIARSTPFVRRSVKANSIASSSQVTSDEALALLENSTIHLDASALLEDESFAPNNGFRSAIFTGPTFQNVSEFYKSTDLFTFETKLSLGEELDDVIKPTQVPQIAGDCPNAETLKYDDFSTASNSSFDSQINWSPIEQVTETLNTPNILYSSSPIKETTEHSSIGRVHKDSLSEIFHENSIQSSTPGKPTKGNKIKSEHIHHKFFLSQAECSNNESSDHLHSNDQDTYDDSFINDNSESGNCDASHVNTSDMMKVYLQAIRSPQLFPDSFKSPPAKITFISPKTCDKGYMKRNNFIFSQTPEQDEYELDSFCVDDDAPLIFQNPKSTPPAPKIRRRIRTGTQIQQSFV
uniref:Fanconi anemia group M protein n=1 Tax=Trichobilharzia regenti TaxID=157069 RepID=A0AA85JND8_TRIRE|nr:unnamed protein product [Trichobilharzia regenti]